MKRTYTVLLTCLAVLACSAMAAAQQEKIKEKIAPEKNININKIIRIHYSGAVIPEIVTVKPGSTVVWINESKSPVEIQFEGKQVSLACKNPVHFVLTEDGVFISNRIPNGAVASMCFIETGEFSFSARKVPAAYAAKLSERQRIQEFKGKIIVKRD